MPRPSVPSPTPASDCEPAGRPLRRQRLACPRCGSSVRRRRRRGGLQRWLWRAAERAQFRCADAGCGWAGVLTTRLDTDRAPAGRWQQRALRGIVPLLLAGLAMLAAQWGASVAPVASVEVGTRRFAPGEAFDGEALPLGHPLLLPAAHSMAASADAHDDMPTAQARPLTLRRFCAWGRPGRMPFRGTPEEALLAARLPKPVRDQIGASIAAGRPHERLLIANDGIRTASGARSFAADGFAMTYGRTLCLGARVNFKPDHVEPASLYEAFDEEGRRYSVMVPDVCGNVSVLRPQGDGWTSTAAAPGTPVSGLRFLDPGHPTARVMYAVVAAKPNEVPTPGTLALSLVALVAALGIGRRAKSSPAAGMDDARSRRRPPGAPD